MNKLKVLSIFLLIAWLMSCARVPISNRKQVNLMPEVELIGMSYEAYGSFLNENTIVSEFDKDAQTVRRAGNRIAEVVEVYMKKNGMASRVKHFDWQFNLVEDPTVNAWCMPGGRVVFYRGIMPVCKNELGVAVVMGHEIAHAIARHGNERMSQQMIVQAGGATLAVLLREKPQVAQDLFMTSYGVGSSLGSLKFSRQHETEADQLGLVFMAMAGYDPSEAPKFWERMAAAGGASVPEFLSTHPSHETRVSDLNEFMPEALKYYKP